MLVLVQHSISALGEPDASRGPLQTLARPAANADAVLCAARVSGKFLGEMAAAMPTCSYCSNCWVLGRRLYTIWHQIVRRCQVLRQWPWCRLADPLGDERGDHLSKVAQVLCNLAKRSAAVPAGCVSPDIYRWLSAVYYFCKSTFAAEPARLNTAWWQDSKSRLFDHRWPLANCQQ